MAQDNNVREHVHEYESEYESGRYCSNCLQIIAVKHDVIEHRTYHPDEVAARESAGL